MDEACRYSRSPAWDELVPEKGLASTAAISTHTVSAVTMSGPGDESSDSEAEQEGPQKLIRKVSTSGQIRSKTSIKEGLLLKQTSSFQRWKKRYFKLRGRTLYYAKDAKSLIFDEVDLSDASVAESSTKNVNNSFTVGASHTDNTHGRAHTHTHFSHFLSHLFMLTITSRSHRDRKQEMLSGQFR
ncbi:diacylglycerol kinase eta-like [Thalassophryne amazonica]|uniref:diacylglycerol kinase eta-like n=1 Tax=Thalassophryne amazonica TaxID=390379 RepID=UPI00147101EC|nr:diacylglycerol kinase eta-like [Thalassophryne amazonica]